MKPNADQYLLLPTDQNQNQNYNAIIYFKYLGYVFCIISAFPTAMLNGLAGIVDDPTQVNEIDSLEDLKDLIVAAEPSNLILGIIAFGATESILFYLNKRYLYSASKTTLDLLRRTTHTLHDTILRRETEPANRANIFDNLLFVTALANSLTFAEMGGEALSFLGDYGKGFGFALSFSVYFATRYSGAKHFFDNIFDENFKLKKRYLKEVERVMQDHPGVNINSEIKDDVNEAVVEFLNKLNRLDLDKKTLRKFVDFIQFFSGVSLVVLTTMPVVASYIPSSIQGLELITGIDIGANENYQNASSFALGAFLTALTLFFYEVHTNDLPSHLMTTIYSMHEKVSHDKNKDALFMLSLTLLAFATSYFTGMGFKLVADDALESGYLSYLGNTVSKLVPMGLFASIITMFWSHLQDLINQRYETQLATSDLDEIQTVNMGNIKHFLRDSKTNIQAIEPRPSRCCFFKTQARQNRETERPLLNTASNSEFAESYVICNA